MQTELGVPLATDKLEGPTQCLTSLGIEVDTQDGTRLPADKLSRLQEALLQWTPQKACRRHQLESLIGTLQHACRPGRSAFLRRMIDLLRIPSATRSPPHPPEPPVPRRPAVVADNCKALEQNNSTASGQPTVISDASDQWGCGAWSQCSWFQYQWPESAQQLHISYKELFAGLLAAATCGSSWYGTNVEWFCDNQAAVQAVTSRSCRDQLMMHLIRCRFFLEAWYNFQWTSPAWTARFASIVTEE